MTNLQINPAVANVKHSSLNEDVTTWAFYPATTTTTTTTTTSPTTTGHDDTLNILDTYNFNNWNTSCQNWETMLDTFIPPSTNHDHRHNDKLMIKQEPFSSTADHTMSLPPTPPLQSPTHPIFNMDFFNPTTTTANPYVYTTTSTTATSTNPFKDITPPPPASHTDPTHLNNMIKLEEMELIHSHSSIHPLSSSSSSSSSSSTNSSMTSLSPPSSSQSSSQPLPNQLNMLSTLNNNNYLPSSHQEKITNNDNKDLHHHHDTIMKNNNNNKYRRRASDSNQHRQPRQQRRRSTHPSVASVVSLTAHEPVSSLINGIEHITFLYSHERLVKEYTIRTDVDSVDLDTIPFSFRCQNTIYPRANVEKEDYTGNRWNYESSCNTLGWKLCWLNQQQLCGKRGLIQRAVDSYRNRHTDMRSRRVTRQEKVANGTLRKRRSKKSIS
ncbi:hypothetical protein BJ944DRAFT_266471 [Cunninghamella echinulata]|nr:hypothetical protein BJ944DRAFT_266471 [Cunninghamella echinulata]